LASALALPGAEAASDLCDAMIASRLRASEVLFRRNHCADGANVRPTQTTLGANFAEFVWCYLNGYLGEMQKETLPP
jgi:hypothetical protein